MSEKCQFKSLMICSHQQLMSFCGVSWWRRDLSKARWRTGWLELNGTEKYAIYPGTADVLPCRLVAVNTRVGEWWSGDTQNQRLFEVAPFLLVIPDLNLPLKDLRAFVWFSLKLHESSSSEASIVYTKWGWNVIIPSKVTKHNLK